MALRGVLIPHTVGAGNVVIQGGEACQRLVIVEKGELLAVEHDLGLPAEENQAMVTKAQAVAQGGTAILAAQGRDVRSHRLMPGDMWGEINLLQVGEVNAPRCPHTYIYQRSIPGYCRCLSPSRTWNVCAIHDTPGWPTKLGVPEHSYS